MLFKKQRKEKLSGGVIIYVSSLSLFVRKSSVDQVEVKQFKCTFHQMISSVWIEFLLASSEFSPPTIEIRFISKEDIQQNYDTVSKPRWEQLPKLGPINGIRSFHDFDPANINRMDCKITSLSADCSSFEMIHSTNSKNIRRIDGIQQIAVNDYVISKYNKKWWLARVQSVETGKIELVLSYLHSPGHSQAFNFPKTFDEYSTHISDILCVLVETPTIDKRNTHRLNKNQFDDIQHLYKNS
jgi:hypothetical protein